MKKTVKGFTLIEILVVIGIIAILAGIVLVAINPARQFAQANDSQRTSNVNAILNAIGQYIADNRGAVPSEITTSELEISTGGANICAKLVPTYLPALPSDPTAGSYNNCSNYSSGYYVVKDVNNRVTVIASSTQATTTAIRVTR